MSATSARTSSYRIRNPTGQAVVFLNGRDFYLGRYGTRTSHAEYDRLVAELLTNGRRLPARVSGAGSDLALNELLVDYSRHADSYYVKNGEPAVEPGNIRLALRPLPQLCGQTPPGSSGRWP